jgi:hypothetical protein
MDRDREEIGTLTRTGTGKSRDMDTDRDRDRDGDMGRDRDGKKGTRTGKRTWTGIQKGRDISAGYPTPGNNFESEYLSEFETEFKNNLGYEAGVYMGLIHENLVLLSL